MRKETLLAVAFAAAASVISMLPAKKMGAEIPFEPDGGTILQDPALCANQFCHSTFEGSTLNDLGTVSFVNRPNTYVPGRSYELGLVITGKQFVPPGTGRVFGFQLATVFADETQAGSLVGITPDVTTVQAGGVDFLTHHERLPSGLVDFRWTAAAAGGGPVTLRVAANAGNNNDMASGDAISTNEAVISEGSGESVVYYFPQIGVGTTGTSTFETDLVFVNTGADAALLVEVFESSGDPMTVRIESSRGDPLVGDSTQLQLLRGASIELGLRGLGEISPGYARVVTGPGVGGVAIFGLLTDPQNGGPLQTLSDSGVPSSGPVQDFSLSVQVISDVSDTGLAIVNLAGKEGQSASTVPSETRLSLYDQNFVLIETVDLPLEPGEHRSRFLSQLFAALNGEGIDFRGSVTVTSDQAVAAVTLRQTAALTLTALPVLPGRADQN